ncbi:hypothetical protein [Bradyrhizobium sp. NBAIM01]|uniref:hypothetical protein n=1 Tax=Bradyrhizobium sp. NBAIM01 TaxID=2793818 RepID=UPI001CD752A3|nr:hypothetical protein [Bradyrhizobium sp. NBAIM01]
MGMVMIKCPETGRAISTGIEMDRERFRCSVVFFSRTYCEMCAATHEWFAKEAWVYETGSPGVGSRSARGRREEAA